jgi:hypothetical protein
MSAWTPRQQGVYRGLVAAAWQKQGGGDRAAHDRWYRETLHAELGVYSTKQLDQNKYAAACAAFEQIVGDSFYWTERALGGTDAERKRRVVHLIEEMKPRLVKAGVDLDYADGAARQAIGNKPLTYPLESHSLPELLAILGALKAVVTRNPQLATA